MSIPRFQSHQFAAIGTIVLFLGCTSGYESNVDEAGDGDPAPCSIVDSGVQGDAGAVADTGADAAADAGADTEPKPVRTDDGEPGITCSGERPIISGQLKTVPGNVPFNEATVSVKNRRIAEEGEDS